MMHVVEADMRSVIIAAAIMAGGALPAQAQELASSFDQLRVLVKVGDRLTVTDTSGQIATGRLMRLAGTSLEVEVDGVAQLVAQDRVSTIRLRQPDSLANGAKIGFAIGAGLGALVGVAIANDFGSPGAIPGIILVYGAMGAGIGVGCDGLVSGNRVIFSRPTPQAAGLRAAPIVGSGRRGVQLTVGF
jgi:hypothetical protein